MSKPGPISYQEFVQFWAHKMRSINVILTEQEIEQIWQKWQSQDCLLCRARYAPYRSIFDPDGVTKLFSLCETCFEKPSMLVELEFLLDDGVTVSARH